MTCHKKSGDLNGSKRFLNPEDYIEKNPSQKQGKITRNQNLRLMKQIFGCKRCLCNKIIFPISLQKVINN
jgi:hypothetical protein